MVAAQPLEPRPPLEFWKRWHISLSSWLRDYLYISLGGSRNGSLNTYRNLAITMLLGGLWHGAAWTFVIWGAYQGILLIVYRLAEPLLKKIHQPAGLLGKRAWFSLRVIFFFHLLCLGWLIFRAESMSQVFSMLHSLIFNFQFTSVIGLKFNILKTIFFLCPLLILQLLQFRNNDLMIVSRRHRLVRFAFYYACCLLMMGFGAFGQNQFIYFQF